MFKLLVKFGPNDNFGYIMFLYLTIFQTLTNKMLVPSSLVISYDYSNYTTTRITTTTYTHKCRYHHIVSKQTILFRQTQHNKNSKMSQ